MGTIYRNGHQYVGQNTDSASLIFLDDERSVQEGIDDAEDSITQLNNELNGLIKSVTKNITTDTNGSCILMNGLAYLPLLIVNNTSGVYPLFMPFAYNGGVRVRVLDFSNPAYAPLASKTMSVTIYYLQR